MAPLKCNIFLQLHIIISEFNFVRFNFDLSLFFIILHVHVVTSKYFYLYYCLENNAEVCFSIYAKLNGTVITFHMKIF